MTTRKRFFSGESSHDQLPLSSSSSVGALSSPPSSGNLRLAPGRSFSSSAALLRQRGSGSPSSPVKRTYTGDIDEFMQSPGPYAQVNAAPSINTVNTLFQAVFLIAFLCLCIFGVATHENNFELQHTLTLKDHEIEHHVNHATELEKKVQKLRSETIELNRQIENLEEMPAAGFTEMQRKLFHLEHAQNLVQQGIQASDRRALRERFGPGPFYYVELKLNFPGEVSSSSSTASNTLLIETAHVDQMPHSVHLFLEQVSHGLYDQTSFHRNANHILQAGPSHNREAHARFRRHPSLMSVLFQEYNPDFPHKQYTLGYPGRPGGPDFFINVRDNTQLHGPGGQPSHYSDLVADADPCFAKVVAGMDAIHRLQQSKVDWQDVMVDPVGIETMKVISKEEYQQRIGRRIEPAL